MQAIEAENYIDQAPVSLLREGIDAPDGIRARFEKVIRAAQDSICDAISEVDGVKFHQDAWTRPGGGGGISRVLQVRHTRVVLGLCMFHPAATWRAELAVATRVHCLPACLPCGVSVPALQLACQQRALSTPALKPVWADQGDDILAPTCRTATCGRRPA